MSKKRKNYSITLQPQKYTEEHEVWGCSNPQVLDRTMMCDGDCSMCGYKTVQKYKFGT